MLKQVLKIANRLKSQKQGASLARQTHEETFVFRKLDS
ncbi:hypothetical protein MGCS35922_04146 [Streptococcus dysgalactiae subsp. equisimilis]|nr:hypothetical protein MGCS36083_04144 [Streptococcus dysgalactiae subsp. equisimilis]WEQ85388.1 hypothetical protein MGCS35957_04246 [Streptococcus dysgalactiae subsp. equisimilis]WEQ87442.1 hypothetical protein MGCS35922_04146 [Streptococcus dysgalactiae subsp. equisimilis]WEQ89519.1 hypothetical protein MGCS35823_04130 [Streptococcus dysgalactiae subsp. equisimilis]